MRTHSSNRPETLLRLDLARILSLFRRLGSSVTPVVASAVSELMIPNVYAFQQPRQSLSDFFNHFMLPLFRCLLSYLHDAFLLHQHSTRNCL